MGGGRWSCILQVATASIREVTVKKLSVSPSLIGKIKPAHSGFALSSSKTEVRDTILKARNGLLLSGAKLEPATNWISILIPIVPSTTCLEQGQIDIYNTMIERICSVRPAHLKIYGRNDTNAPHRTWMAYFTKAPRGRFRAFDESGIARSFKKQQPLQFYICMAATKCRNCSGPHCSDSCRCLSRPTRSGAHTKEQMKVCRQMGDREDQAILRAKAAEENSASSETTILNAPSSQITEINSSADDTLASPVESSTCVAYRL
ncbi:putative eka-like protein [Erysiphe necator]|uniref:Putative eka-like protein n=1 Tax=Uncinula necator TaxID=52586 RepID=A0A0B1P0V0_UNCNE|nr:putative eka-like protein [Erysiphe necator]